MKNKISTYNTKNFDGIPLGVPNEISKENEGFYVSYNNVDVRDYEGDTTALYIEETSQFLILNGDHREAYENLNTLGEHLEYFYKNKESINPKSENGKIFKEIDGCFKYVKGGY